MIISGAFGLFRRDAVEQVGGFWAGTIGEDMELVMRLHRAHVRRRVPHRIVFTPDPICWTEVPSDLRSLRGQRNRWHRGLWTNLWRHRAMLCNPRYGRLGMVAVPYFWLFEGLGPVVEIVGFTSFALAAAFGLLDPGMLVLFLVLAVLQGVLVSQMAVGVEAMLLQRYPRGRDRLVLLAAGLLEFLGFHQLLSLERFRATVEALLRRPPTWGHMRRAGLSSEREPSEVA
jgi:cellulose synthase/poly-beta-1,6-N-acetylglucosamine synthase-like glycosyltransferase